MTLTLPGPLVSPQWLATHLDDPELVVLDASIAPAEPTDETIGGALRFDIDGPLSDHTADLPHTMPSPEQFRREIRRLGVGRESAVVVYDSMGIYSSARAWWMLRAMGHDAVAVLDGGLPGWQRAGLPTVSRRAEGPVEGDFEPQPREGWFVDADEVLTRLDDPAHTVLDARSRGRFAGTHPEPRPGLRGGHMPGARNLPFTDLLDDGFVIPLEDLRRAFSEVSDDDQRLTMSCGSGVTACVLALGATLAGRTDIAVYDGSWSEWGRPGPLPVESA